MIEVFQHKHCQQLLKHFGICHYTIIILCAKAVYLGDKNEVNFVSNTPFFSVIVPAYNSEKYIYKGLNSIKAQTFKDYELIIVCDSYTDKTEEIVRRYTDKVYISNYGSAGGSRNIGIDNAIGEWILFMDDDDWWLHERAFEKLAKQCKSSTTDIVAFSFVYRNQGYAKCGKWIAVWNKAWRRSYLNSKPYRFPTTLFWDDTKFTEEAHPNATFTFFDEPLYCYNFMRQGSVSQRKEDGEFGTRVDDEYKLLYKNI